MQPFVKHVRVEKPLCHYTIPSSCGVSEPSTTRWDFKQPFLRGCRICQVAVRLLASNNLPTTLWDFDENLFTDYWKINRLTGGIPFFKNRYHTPLFLTGYTVQKLFVSAVCMLIRINKTVWEPRSSADRYVNTAHWKNPCFPFSCNLLGCSLMPSVSAWPSVTSVRF